MQSSLRIDVINAFDHLQTHLNSLHKALLKDHHLATWVQSLAGTPYHSLHDDNPRERAFNAINQLEYMHDQAPREILICAGFLGASNDTIKVAQQLNEAKDHFKATIIALKTEKITLKDAALGEQFDRKLSKNRNTTIANALNKTGLARLHLKQCYRKLPILTSHPKKISWTWAHTRSIKKVSVNEAYQMLIKKPQDEGIQIQLKKLAALSSNEPLAIVQELAPHLRANIVLSNKDIANPRLMVKGPVPILFPCKPSDPTPAFKPPTEKKAKDSERVIRADVRLDPTPFLPAIRAHRYLTLPVEG